MKSPFRILSLCLLVLALIPSLFSCRDAQEKVLFKIGSYPITVEEYTYFYRNCLSSSAPDTLPDAIHEQVLTLLRRKYAITQMAENYKVKLTEEDETEAEETYRSYADYYGSEEAMLSAMAESHMTERYFRSTLTYNILERKVRDYVCDPYTGDILADDATVEADIPLHFYRASQILLIPEDGKDLSSLTDTAQQLCRRAKDGEDFEALIAAYSSDQKTDPHDGYYFTDGQLLTAFEDTVKGLEIGQISDVVESEVGYHIIKRLPLEDAYIDKHFEDLRDLYRTRIFNARAQEIADAFSVTYYDRFYEFEP